MVRKVDVMMNLKFIKLKPIIGQGMSMHGDNVFFEFSDVFKILTQRAFKKEKDKKFEVTN